MADENVQRSKGETPITFKAFFKVINASLQD